MRWLLLFLLGAWLAHGLPAQDSLVVQPQEPIVTRGFDAERIAAYKADPDLDYDRDLRHEPSLWERFKAWLARWMEEVLGSRASSFVINNLLIILAAVMLVVVVSVLSRHGLRKVFHGESRSTGQVTADEEDIREMDLAALIREAEQAGDLRRAIRLHYLLVLRKLVDRGVLIWSPEQTDRDYMAQIKDVALRSRFAHAALVFQWVWYGHAEVDPERYESIRRPFIEFDTATVR